VPAEAKPSIQLIVGLGNPGPTYAETRHNAGTWFIEEFCQYQHLTLKTDAKFNARVAQTSINGKEVKILVSNTYMNHSGRSVGSIAKYYQIPTNAILVVHDELDIPSGAIRFKTDGGHGGHNGLRDIIHHLGSREFHRLRIGIGHPGHKDEVHDYVLCKPSKQDHRRIRLAIEEALKLCSQIIDGDWQIVRNQLHSLHIIEA
jgi:PTH1 family peptidyl-tRNA hydrolase